MFWITCIGLVSLVGVGLTGCAAIVGVGVCLTGIGEMGDNGLVNAPVVTVSSHTANIIVIRIIGIIFFIVAFLYPK